MKRSNPQKTKPHAALCVMSAAMLLMSPQAISAPGDIDSSFGTSGVAIARIDYTTGSGVKNDRIEAILVQPDGKIVAAGSTLFTYRDSAVARFNPDGSLDTSFVGTGKGVYNNSGWNDEVFAVALQTDGRIVVAGYTIESGNSTKFAISRLDSNGALDTSFSDDGVAILNRRTNALTEVAYAVGIQPSGKILVAGNSSDGTTFNYSAVARLNADGTLDNTFRGAGKFSEYNRRPLAMHVLPDGRFLLAGGYSPNTLESRHWVALYGVNGALEGETITATAVPRGSGNSQAYGSVATSVTVDPNGDIWTVGSGIGGESNVLVKYAGGLGTGTVTAIPYDVGGRISMQPSGKLLALGNTIARFDLTPQLDPTFSQELITEGPGAFGLRSPRAIACQGNGGVFVGGVSDQGYFAVARFLLDGNPPTDITATPAEIAENIPAGALVGTLSAVDADAGDTFQYSLASGAGDTHNSHFVVTGNQVFTAAVFDFEAGETRSIRVRVVDSTASVYEKAVTIKLLDDLSEDIDGDGLNQQQEKFYGSNDFSTDSDGDGIGDYVEVHTHHSRPGSKDSDGDGVEDGDELALGTGIIDSDSDDDGLNDGSEIARTANPLDPDTDGDGFLDGYEVQTGKSPTDPLNKPALVAEARTAIELTFPTAIGKTYRIEASLDMAEWAPIEENINGTGEAVTRFYTTRNMPKRFLRVEEQN
jgi:uncharacterized delta-60 repeat protein